MFDSLTAAALIRDTQRDAFRGKACAMNHLGLWLVEPERARTTIAALRSGPMPMDDDDEKREMPILYQRTKTGIALIPVIGQIMKGDSKFGGCNSLRVRRAINAASRDNDCKGIMFVFDSPGGTVAGTAEVADDIARVGRDKPCHAFVDDLCASAAYWMASQCSRVTSNAMGEIGSIGVLAVLYDSSEAASIAGVKVHVIATGPLKAAGVDGAPVTDEHLEYLQERVDSAAQHFFDAVRKGRKLSAKQMSDATTGRVFGAAAAQALGLIDGVGTLDRAVADLDAEVTRVSKAARASRQLRVACAKTCEK